MENKAIKLGDILRDKPYIIPGYQRNYAWGRKEISQLIQDIDEYFDGANKEKSYYLGTLVCFKKEENGRSCYELVDGQQRHTTITLINLVLKNWEGKSFEDTVSASNLMFDSRKKSQTYIENLYQIKTEEKGSFDKQINEYNVSGTGNFKDAIELIREDLRIIEKRKQGDLEKFADNFYNHVFLFRVELPEDTDLNHYFEIMNNRGEQLEKHEIVKALLMGGSKLGERDRKKFAVIWDACSDMSDYVYFNFDTKIRAELFDGVGKLSVESFSEIPFDENTDGESEKETLADIIAKNVLFGGTEETNQAKDKYKSVIDFPNFLLQVLKLKNRDVSLDDKKLVAQFSTVKPDSEEFIFDLLKYRTLFDKYVIKQDLANADDDKPKWGIRKLNYNDSSTIKTFEGKDEEELVKLQVMLHYSYSPNTYNKWLFEILDGLSFEENASEYTQRIFAYAATKCFNKDNLEYPYISIFNLYFIDFLLWKLYKECDVTSENDTEIDRLKRKISGQKGLFNDFKFRQLSSREHLAARNNISSKEFIPDDILNGIGNLCLISSSQNSEANRESPKDKKVRFGKSNLSLKRLIMFAGFDGDKWETEQIENHAKEINALLDYYLS